MPEHTYKQFDTELESVRAKVLKMGGLVEEQISRSIEALVQDDMDLADEVEANDHAVNGLEVEIDEDCAQIIARRQPTASDLRMVMMIVKTITDLERIGDEASKIARMAKLIHAAERMTLPRFSEVKYMASMVLDMLRKALDGLYFDVGYVRIIGKGDKERLVPIGSPAIKFINLYPARIKIFNPLSFKPRSSRNIFLSSYESN